MHMPILFPQREYLKRVNRCPAGKSLKFVRRASLDNVPARRFFLKGAAGRQCIYSGIVSMPPTLFHAPNCIVRIYGNFVGILRGNHNWHIMCFNSVRLPVP